MRTDDLNMFPSMPMGDPVHAVVVNAESADVDTVLIAGKVAKRGGKLTFAADKLVKLKAELLESRERIMHAGNFVYRPAPQGDRA